MAAYKTRGKGGINENSEGHVSSLFLLLEWRKRRDHCIESKHTERRSEKISRCHQAPRGLQVDISKGARQTVMGLVGNTEVVDVEQIQSYECVDKVMRVEVPYKRASRAFHPQDSVIPVGNSGVTIGGKKLAVIAGPCSIETPDQIEGVAHDVAGANIPAAVLRRVLRGRTSRFSNMCPDMLRDAAARRNCWSLREIMSADKLPVFLEDGVDDHPDRGPEHAELRPPQSRR